MVIQKTQDGVTEEDGAAEVYEYMEMMRFDSLSDVEKIEQQFRSCNRNRRVGNRIFIGLMTQVEAVVAKIGVVKLIFRAGQLHQK